MPVKFHPKSKQNVKIGVKKIEESDIGHRNVHPNFMDNLKVEVPACPRNNVAVNQQEWEERERGGWERI